MTGKNKFRTAFVIASLAFGVSLLIVGKNAKAQTTAPNFSALQFRISISETSKEDKDLRELRVARNKALTELNEHTLDSKSDNQREGLRKLSAAYDAIFNVCGAGSTHLQTRLRKNSNNSWWWSLASGIAGTGTLAASAINASKGWSVATAASTYQSIASKEGDAAHNSETLVKIFDEVRSELKVAANNYNTAMQKQPQKSIEDFSTAKLAIYQMHNACAFF